MSKIDTILFLCKNIFTYQISCIFLFNASIEKGGPFEPPFVMTRKTYATTTKPKILKNSRGIFLELKRPRTNHSIKRLAVSRALAHSKFSVTSWADRRMHNRYSGWRGITSWMLFATNNAAMDSVASTRLQNDYRPFGQDHFGHADEALSAYESTLRNRSSTFWIQRCVHRGQYLP